MTSPLSIAIVGAGPAGFYTAEALLDRCEHCQVDIIERLPTPYGLIRAGVAPDHQSVKRVDQRFERTAVRAPVRYFGNVTVGRDISFEEVCHLYDAVVLAVGAPVDRYLGIPGEDLAGIYGSALFVGWYNGHPDFHDIAPPLDRSSAVVIGLGNVALDVARILVRTEAELADSDVPRSVAARLRASSVEDVHIVGRRGPLEAKFTIAELREMGRLAAADVIVHADDLPTTIADTVPDHRQKQKVMSVLRDFADRGPPTKPRRVHIHFCSTPLAFEGKERVEALCVERSRGSGETTIPCGLAVAAIGYTFEPIPGVPFDDRSGRIRHHNGRATPGVYAVGWAKRGPVGVIGSNRPDGQECAEQILEDFPEGGRRSGRKALASLLKERGVRVVSFDDWRRIDAAEREAADGVQPRAKFTRIDDMFHVLDRQSSDILHNE